MVNRTWAAHLLVALFTAACAAGGTPAPAELTLEAADFKYGPDRIEVAVGQPVKITFINTGALEHDFSIRQIDVADVAISQPGEQGHAHGAESLDLHVMAPVGDRSTLAFTVLQAGTYEYFCSVPGHREAGMVGRLIAR